MAGCQIDVLPGDISDIIMKKKVSYGRFVLICKRCTTLVLSIDTSTTW